MTGGLHCNFGKAEQGTESKVGRIGDCPESEDKSHLTSSETKNNNVKVERQTSCRKVQVTVAVD
jgi:hypothetical protein